MKDEQTTQPVASRQRAHRSAVSNGTRLFCVDGLDGRTQTARRFRDLVEVIGNDLGGADRLSEGQKQLIRRAATLSTMAESVEADMVRDMAFDVLVYGTVGDRLRRILESLGLERVPKDVGTTVFRIIGGPPPPPMQTHPLADIFRPAKQRPALLQLAAHLDSRTSALRKDECGDWAIFGER